jgi:cytosine permease
MARDTSTAANSSLPTYLQAAKPNPLSNRAPWYKNTAPTYAGVFLWFVFWNSIASNGLDTGGLALTLAGVFLGGLICHFLFYLAPGLLGMKTGLPLYIVGTSTFGSVGGLLMPGFLMGLLQFGWLAVNTYYAASFLAEEALKAFGGNSDVYFYVLCVAWAATAAFIGLKGIQYVAKVATFLPLIPLAVLVLALAKFAPAAGSYRPQVPAHNWDFFAPISAMFSMVGAIVGFFATAGAAGVDFGMNSKDAADVNRGGLVGIFLAILLTAGGAVVAVAGAHVTGALPNLQTHQLVEERMLQQGKNPLDPSTLREIMEAERREDLTLTNALKSEKAGLPPWLVSAMMIGLTLAAFPGACFSSFIAANSFKTVMPQVNSFLSVGLGALVSIVLAMTGVAGNLERVFGLIGASFGPICGAMCADYLLAGRKWAGPRGGFNPAGWAAWLLGFIVGILPNFQVNVPAAPVVAFGVGFVVYFTLAKAGLESKVLPYGPAQQP